MIDENLKTAIRSNKLILFIGAGASIPLKYPSWKKLVSEILDDLNEQFGEFSDLNFINLKRSLENDTKSPLEILNKIENDSSSGDIYKKKAKEYTHKIFNEINVNNSLDSDIHKLLWEVSSKIITTNYDQILEVNKPNDRTIDVFENANSFLVRKSQYDNSKFLYKIHGDFKNPDNIILFKSDYETIYGQETSNANALGDFFKNKTFLFLGFSLSDPFINDLFAKIKKLYNNYTVGNHYIFYTNVHNDFSSFDVKPIKVDDWGESLGNYLKALIKEKDNDMHVISNQNYDSLSEEISAVEEDIDSLFMLIKSKTEDLKKDPSNQILASEMHDLKSKIDKLIYGELDYLKTFDKAYKNNHLKMLFDTIYGNDKLTQETINEINRIRTDYDNHQWFERCQLISALTCSLFIFNKADEKKISLLVDFINDNESKVWERALTYLVMILNHLGNKWLRFESIKRKVKSLTLNIKVQDACQQIVEYILIFGIGRFNFSENVFENPYFRDNPFNYFLPFFKENNPLFNNIYDNYKGEDIDGFIDFLEESSFPDAIKYIYCNTELKPRSKKAGENKDVSEIRATIIHHLSINESYFPFAGYIQEFVSFLKSFPTLQQKRLIDTQLKITSTPLKDYLLSEKEKFRVLGMHFLKEKNWGQAIINFEKYINLSSSEDIMILDNLANCYLNIKSTLKAKEISIQILEFSPKHQYNLLRLADIYSSEANDELALEMLEKYNSIDSGNSLGFFRKSLILFSLERYDEALISIQQVDESFEDKAAVYDVYGLIYRELKRYSESLESFDKAISLDEKRPGFYYHKAEVYGEMEEFEKAIMYVNMALDIEVKDEYYFAKVYYLLNAGEIKNAYLILSKTKTKNEEYFNILANYHRLNGEYELALTTIDKLIASSSNKRFIGTKAAIYASMQDDENFYKFLEEVLNEGIKAEMFLKDVKDRYRKEERFIKILDRYKQIL